MVIHEDNDITVSYNIRIHILYKYNNTMAVEERYITNTHLKME